MKCILSLLTLFTGFAAAAQNVGVGTTTPATPLHVKTTGSGEVLRVEGSSPYIGFFEGNTYSGYLWHNFFQNRMELGTPVGSTQPVVIAPAVTPLAYFTTTGRMGLGTSTPSEKLDVNGNINLNGLIKINGSSGSAGQVLTSNGSGDPEWRNAAFSNNTRFSFNISTTGTATGTASVEYPTTVYNLTPADVTKNTTTIVFNKAGLYHLDIILTTHAYYASTVAHGPVLSFQLLTPTAGYTIGVDESMASIIGNDNYVLDKHFSIDLYMSAGLAVNILYTFSATIGTPAMIISGKFAGYLISE